MEQKIIYQILIDRFSGNITSEKNDNHFMGGNLAGIIGHLDYIKELGFNTILLSPFLQSTSYHGYHTENFYEVDSHFGTINDVQNLIRESHIRNIKLMFDFVPNHCSYKHPFFVDAIKNPHSPYKNWFYISSPTFYRSFLQHRELPKFNLNNPDTANYIIKTCQYWLSLGFDYVRIDHTIGVPFAFLSRLVQESKQQNSKISFIGEVWGQRIPRRYFHTIYLKHLWRNYLFGINQENLQKDYIGILDGVFDFEFTNLIVSAILQGEKCMGNKKLQQKVDQHFSRYPADFDLVLMLDNHDMNRFLYYCKGDSNKLLDAIRFIKEQHRSFSIYYGTENKMMNTKDIFDKTAYADLRVREVFQLSAPILYKEISSILKR
ncbi:MAG: alpha-amylase family glycosyl hydrolase [Massilibacteroides sp.]|nr:alpha-amylase family glycosyl hydrolase [Massilibacteroides sp.]MDD3062549.1 alpha-amylase family glycosyl hydrolase [Massilibacteroides sp.]MDD4114518.1 alpha-amylase family glycosyl hydrolase [Massilibacteroides sp.]MDD4659359.1 alpha-amylase family glycosyl hydrolase [Massilibacteroides sp.]